MGMKFTQKHGVARLRVALLDPDLVSDLVEVVIGEYVYELQFRGEKEDMASNHVPINMDNNPDNENEGNGNANGKSQQNNRDT